MKQAISFRLLLLAVIITLLFSCSKNGKDSVNCTLQLNPIKINFNVLDKTTNEDLYFSSNPRFQTKDLYLFNKKDVARKDTIRPAITGSGTTRSFQYIVDYSSLQDTLILRTDDLSDNTLIYTIQKTNGDCPNYKLINVIFNGSIITPMQDKYIFLK